MAARQRGTRSLFGFNLPDFGASEALGIGRPNPNVQTGGSLFFPGQGSSFQQSPVGPAQPFIGPTRPSARVVDQGPSARVVPGQSFGAGAGGGGGGVGPTGIDQGFPQEVRPEAPPPGPDISAGLSALGQAETAARAGTAASLTGIEASRGQAVGRIESAQELQEEQLGRAQTREEQRAQDNVNEQRRAFVEQQRALASRFGSSISTGLGAEAIIGRQALQGIASSRQALSTTLDNIRFERSRVVEETNRARESAESQALTLKQDANANLQANLAQISGERGRLQFAKAERTFEALENFRSVIAGINQREASFKQQLFLEGQQADQVALAAEQRNIQEFFTTFDEVNRGVTSGILQPNEARGFLGLPEGAAGTQVTDEAQRELDELAAQ